MPLLHRKYFSPKKPPDDLVPNEKIFYCPLTKEVFRDYEEFYERTILCNSLVWSCSITDRPNLTFQEALDCEAAAKKKLAKIPASILKPVLFLVGLFTRSRIDELNDDIYGFVKERYFSGEEVEVFDQSKSGKTSTTKSTCKITKVVSGRSSSSNGHAYGEAITIDDSSSDEDDEMPLSSYQSLKSLEPNEVLYQVQKLKAPGASEKVVPSALIRRRQGIYTRQLSKLLLKAYCLKLEGGATQSYVVKTKVKNKLGLDFLSWKDIFAGPTPSFSSPKGQRSKKISAVGTKTSQENESEKIREKLRKEKIEMKLARELEKEEKRKEKEELRKRRTEELERLREVAKLDKERRRKEREEELIKLKVEREMMKHQKQEEKKRLAEYLKEWSRPRDDLECDDLKDLPTPEIVYSDIPPPLFGDALGLMEFFFTFGDLFDAKDEFPQGVNFDVLSNALMMRNHNSPLCDLIFFFLSNLFRTHSEEEDGFNQIFTESTDRELADEFGHNLNEETVQAFCTLASTWSASYQGFTLNKLELDGFTLTEILRLYILTSASRARGEDRVWRYQQRGGYSIMDDTPLGLCMEHPNIVHKLATNSVFSLTPDEKMQILMCLCNHLLSFVTPRDLLDETWEKLQQAQQAYRDDKFAEKRREKDFAAERAKFKGEQTTLSKLARMKELEEKMHRAEQGLSEDLEENPRNLRKRKQTNDEDDGQPKLLTQEEKEDRLRHFEEEESQAKEAWNYRMSKHQTTVNKLQSSFRVLPLGQDRFYRRYWAIRCLPWIFVEEYVDESLTDDLLSLKSPQKKALFPQLAISGCSTPGLSDSSAAGTPMSINSAKSVGVYLVPFNHAPSGISKVLPASPLTLDQNTVPISSTTSTGFKASYDNPALASPVFKSEHSNNNGISHPVQENLVSTNSNEELSSFNQNLSQGKEHRWYLFSTSDDIENLISSLNTRGFRESKLRECLISRKAVLSESLTKNRNRLADVQQITGVKHCTKVNFREQDCEETLKKLLRDQILDLEARIWEGTLGAIKVEDRPLWRDCIENGLKYDGGGYEDFNKNDRRFDEDFLDKDEIICGPVVTFPLQRENSSINFPIKEEPMQTDESRSRCTVTDLAKALLAVEKGIDKKYMKPPLGVAVDTSRTSRSRTANLENDEANRRKSEKLQERWQMSLLACTSVSQVFLHLSTLERCIMWSRSVLNAKCRICRRKGNAEKMLLCDSCDRGHHMYCLRPALKVVPAGDWFCPDCKPKSSRISPRKVMRTKSFSQDESSDEEEGESDEEESEDEENEEESESSEEISEPPKKNLTYKITRPQRKSGGKPSTCGATRSRANDTRKAQRGDGHAKTGSKRRSTGVWKDLAVCEEILSDTIKHRDSWPFLEPVSKKQVPDYYTIIKNPMDLGTVLKKLKNVQYPSPTEFITDVSQIFLNCHEYNDPRSPIAKMATQLQNFFDSKLNKCGLTQYRLSLNTSKKRRTT
ncbi:unnamed protein product [Clavelina lepadiformis]|uniref:Bromodomain adjacent to zinc finger domain protein 1A n=1 Tax=Clavelina lepadiformis TaxID=159417 RepID=A0ABP0GVS7_CLALP